MSSGNSSKLTVFAYGQPPGFLDLTGSLGGIKLCMPYFMRPRVVVGSILHVTDLYNGLIPVVSGEHRRE